MSSWAHAETPVASAKLNQKTLLVDTGANISAATASAGQQALCTATGSGFTVNVLYQRNAANSAWVATGYLQGTAGDIIYSNGTNWQKLGIGTTGQVLSVVSGVPAWAAAPGGLGVGVFVTVTVNGGPGGDGGQFGANTPSTVTNGIQEAVNYVAGSGGGGVHIQRGHYPLTGPVSITTNGISIFGDGDGTLLYLNSSSAGIFVTGTYGGSSAPWANGPFQTSLRDFTITYTTGSPYVAGIGIQTINCFEVAIDNVRVFGTNVAAFRFIDSAALLLNNVYAEGGNGDGFRFEGANNILADNCVGDTFNGNGFSFLASSVSSNQCYKNSLVTCYATLCQGKGFSIFDTSQTTFAGCVADGSIIGFQVGDSNTIDLVSCRSIGNNQGGLQILSSAVSMVNCYINVIGGAYYDTSVGHNISIFAQTAHNISDIHFTNVISSNAGISSGGNYDGFNINNDGSGASVTLVTMTGCVAGNRAGATASQRYGVNILGNTIDTVIEHCTFLGNLTTAISGVLGAFWIRDTFGYFHGAVIGTPWFVGSTNAIGPGGTSTNPVSGTIYTATPSDLMVSMSGGSGVTATFYDTQGNVIGSSSAFTMQYLPRGYKIGITYSSVPAMSVAYFG